MFKNLALFPFIITFVSGLVLNVPFDAQASQFSTVTWFYSPSTDPLTFTLYILNTEVNIQVATDILSSQGVTEFLVPASLVAGSYRLLAASVALGGTGETIPNADILNESLFFDVSAPFDGTGSSGSFPTGSLGSFPTTGSLDSFPTPTTKLSPSVKFTTPQFPEITGEPSESTSVHENRRTGSLVGKIVGPILGFFAVVTSIICCRRRISRKARHDGQIDERTGVPATEATHPPIPFTPTPLQSDYNHSADIQQMGSLNNLHNINNYVPPHAEYNASLSNMPSPNISQDYQSGINHLPGHFTSIPQPSDYNYSAGMQQNTPLGNAHNVDQTNHYGPSLVGYNTYLTTIPNQNANELSQNDPRQLSRIGSPYALPNTAPSVTQIYETSIPQGQPTQPYAQNPHLFRHDDLAKSPVVLSLPPHYSENPVRLGEMATSEAGGSSLTTTSWNSSESEKKRM